MAELNRFFHDLGGISVYTVDMEQMLPLLLAAAMAATVVVLVIGIVSFAVHGDFYKRHSNNLMRLRVLFQGLAVALFAGVVFLSAG